ncbi:MAG: ABC transporter ATP-binding protein [Planctomycetota bacterium]|nr:ABC transporter ATP-binding protein [Planctomycetota bacterium]
MNALLLNQSHTSESSINASEIPGHYAPIIELQSITKSFGRFVALRGVTVSMPSGVTGLLGPNGAGKSTLIKILLGLLRATSGKGSVLGMPLSGSSRAIRQLVGYMPEDDCYLPSLSGVECVQFAARLNCIPAVEALRRSHEILDFCGAGQERYRNVETYSTGMRQKLKFAQAIVHDPPLLILDEPTAGLDPDERDTMLERIRGLSNRHGKSIVICTHILPDVQHVSDYVVILAGGRVSVAKPMTELARPSVPAMQIRTIGPVAVLREALERKGKIVTLSQTGVLNVQGNTDEDIRLIWHTAAEHDVVIRSLLPARNSMETIFLEAIQAMPQGTNHANS